MKPIIEGPPGEDEPRPPLKRALLWFALLAIAGLAATAALAYTLRALIL